MDYTIGNIAPIILLPFAAFVINAFIVKKVPKFAVGLGCITMFASFCYACRVFKDFVFVTYSADYYVHKVFTWFDLGLINGKPFNVDMGIYLDNMSAVLLLMVTGCALIIHIFSTFYMEHDARFGSFFVYLSLFTAAMIGLVLSENLLSVFVFWELMGFCSYSLIGFYYEKEGAGNASMKAFMTTRVGDVFFLVGILAIWSTIGSTSFVDIYAAIASGAFNDLTVVGIPLVTFSAISIFLGTIGKSAQFPLQVWLPDAMWGPTPCSALIHAATMVAAGVYLSLRMYPLMEAGGITTVIAYIGGITAFGAATIALIQTDIKAVLAYSTISQLGYMVLGIGVGAYNAAFMHLITHAVFKACLFLSAGSVIHSLHDHHTDGHVQEMPRMGGLRKKMPFTFIAMLCCTFAIAGFPFFSGFVSKDRILGDALLQALDHKTMIAPAVLGFIAALLTAFYMFRMMFLTFYGEPRDKELYEHTDVETLSWNRNVPLLILTVFTLGFWYSGSLTGQGLVKFPGVEHKEWFSTLIKKPDVEKFTKYKREAWGSTDSRDQFFEKAHYDANHGMTEAQAHHAHHVHHIGAIMSIIIAFFGFFIAYMMYIKKAWSPGWWSSKLSPWYRALQSKYFFDDLYIKVIIQKGLLGMNNFLAWIDMGIYDRYIVDGTEVINRFAYRVSNWFDNKIVDTVGVDGTGASVRLFNVVLRTIQSGKIQFYFMILVVVLVSYIWTLV
ncbi:MAG: NADH-quinone oxidoreductase subunit L [Bacteriovoracaceae bacterium]|jgi:NADH-quinone oxidoreductase subunit L|nr:NADH-quinone oxidoreductase subunit L [Bacteriovoracaceae bacterium]